jgi:photosystem II stability/assembly factor-like uncharacterized protein
MKTRSNLQKGFCWLGMSLLCSLILLLSACGNLPASTASASTHPVTAARGSVTDITQVKSTRTLSASNVSTVKSPKSASIVNSGGPVRLTTVRMINQSVGWAVAANTTVLRTVDGGADWKNVTPVYTNYSSNALPPTFTFTDGLHAWIAYQAGIYQNPVTILRTTDGGQTWERTTISPSDVSHIAALQFRGNTGWLLLGGDPGAGHEGFSFYSTTDGGKNWSFLSTLYTSDQVSGISFLNTTTGFLAFGGPYSTPQLAVTHNGGLTWTNLSLPAIKDLPSADVDEYLTTPPVLFGSHGYLPVYVSTTTGTQGFVIYQSVDSGQTWSAGDAKTLSPTGSPATLSDFYIVDQTHGYVTDAQGATWLTYLNGTQWHKLAGKVGSSVHSLSFTDSQNGWAAGGGLWRTTDGGKSWQVVNYTVQ